MLAQRGLAAVFSLLPSAFKLAHSPPLILVDGTALMFRSYFGIPSVKSKSGTEVNAVAGLSSMLISLLLPTPESVRPTILVVFDSSGPTFREEIYSAYKAQRPPPPVDLGPQFEIAHNMCRAFGWPALTAPGFEADDLIATMAEVVGPQRPVIIVSSDKDFMQLVRDENCLMVCPQKRLLYNEEQVLTKLGVPPSLVVDLLALMGDSADNIPGRCNFHSLG